MLSIVSVNAQQPLKNTAFKAGETINYNLYFNWQFIWVKAGTASMTTTDRSYNGKEAYRCALTTKSSARVDKYFMMRDTLLAYTTKDLVPLYYRKGAREGKRYYIDELNYSYNGGKCTVAMKQTKANGTVTKKQYTSKYNVYDMLSLFMRARSFSIDGWKKGHTIKVPIADGNGTETAELVYLGKTNVKADDGKKYKCLELSYRGPDDGKMKEIVRFFVTDDSRHLPIRLDLSLKFGSAKAFFASGKL